MTQPLITVEKLDKAFGARWALRGVTFQIKQGEIVALVGPNGAGKTTLLRIVSTLARPNAGHVHIGTIPTLEHANDARSAIGFVGHQTFMYDDLTASENLHFFARLYDLPNIPQRVLQVAARVGITNRLNDVTRTLSRGLQQRLTIARMLVARPSRPLARRAVHRLGQSRRRFARRNHGGRAPRRSLRFVFHARFGTRSRHLRSRDHYESRTRRP